MAININGTGSISGLSSISSPSIDGVPVGSASAPAFSFTGDSNTGIYSPGADQVAISTNGVQRVTVDTAATTSTLPVVHPLGAVGTPSITFTGDLNTGFWSPTADTLAASTAGSERLRITSAGNVGIGTTSAQQLLHVNSSGASGGQIQLTNASTGAASTDGVLIGYDGSNDVIINNQEATALKLYTSGTERARIDSSGRLLVGTSSAVTTTNALTAKLQAQGTSAFDTGIAGGLWEASSNPFQFHLVKSRGATVGTHTVVQNGDGLGRIVFGGSDGTDFEAAAYVECFVDGTPGANDMPGRLVFSTTADGASSPTERMRISQNGTSAFYNTGFVIPNTDNAVALGGGTNRWTAVFAVNGTIQTSDARAKTEITNATLGSDFVKALRPVSYKWIEGGQRHTGDYDEDNNFIYESVPGSRTHWGFIAQEVKEAVDAAGVDFGGWVLTDKDDPDSQQALRYDQFIAPLTKALQEALAKIEQLEQRLADAGI